MRQRHASGMQKNRRFSVGNRQRCRHHFSSKLKTGRLERETEVVLVPVAVVGGSGGNGKGHGKDKDNKSGSSKPDSNKGGDGTGLKGMSAFPFAGLIMLAQFLVIPNQWLMF